MYQSSYYCDSYYCDSIIYKDPPLYNHDGTSRNHPNDIDDVGILGVQAADLEVACQLLVSYSFPVFFPQALLLIS